MRILITLFFVIFYPPFLFANEIKISYRHHRFDINFSNSSIALKSPNENIILNLQDCNQIIFNQSLDKIIELKKRILSHFYESKNDSNNILIIIDKTNYKIPVNSKMGEEIILLRPFFEKINIQSEVSCKK